MSSTNESFTQMENCQRLAELNKLRATVELNRVIDGFYSARQKLLDEGPDKMMFQTLQGEGNVAAYLKITFGHRNLASESFDDILNAMNVEERSVVFQIYVMIMNFLLRFTTLLSPYDNIEELKMARAAFFNELSIGSFDFMVKFACAANGFYGDCEPVLGTYGWTAIEYVKGVFAGAGLPIGFLSI